ncbi:MAG: hypothetical protein DHS20C11_07740 [Lysobacteraceae bacterium]|nr:MAG: hypothetical protein DHS20C11_07740 [Xanthomonadaceae bacterium]
MLIGSCILAREIQLLLLPSHVDIVDEMPDGLTRQPANQLYRELGGPTLFKLAGVNPQPVFVSVLQHGNEWTGWDAIRSVLDQFEVLPRTLWLLVANPLAARYGLRRLAGQHDMNREWPGGNADTPMVRAFADIVEQARQADVFASVDLHNTSGRNPPYGAVTSLHSMSLSLARQFDPRIIYFKTPVGTQTGAFSQICPSITLECGMSGNPEGYARSVAFLKWLLHRHSLDHREARDSVVYQTVARLMIDPAVEFGFGTNAPLSLDHHLDSLNFVDLPKGFELAKWDGPGEPMIALDSNDVDVTREYLSYTGQTVALGSKAVPLMFTCDARVVRQDCLGYLMRQMPLELETDHV